MTTRTGLALLGVSAAISVAGLAHAETFGSATYDANTDQLVVTILYRGTNPDHQFSLAWDECTRHPDGTNDAIAEVIDSQERDEARQEFSKTVRLGLDGLDCRPAKVTLRAGPRTFVSVDVPAATR